MKKSVIIIAVVAVIPIAAYLTIVAGSDPTARNVRDFEAAWSRVDEVYPFFELKNIDWDAIHAAYRPRVEASEGDDFHDILRDLLAELKDGHVYFKTDRDDGVMPWPPPRRVHGHKAFSLDLVRARFDRDLRETRSGGALYEILPGNIAYIYLASMNDTDIADEFPGILDYFRETKGMIIDIRTKRGGTIQNVKAVVSRFITAPAELPRYYFLGEHYPMDPVQPQGWTYTNRVVVLINGMTFSAGESITLILQQQPQVTVIGDTTGGGGGTASAHSTETEGNYLLPSGIMINIPTGYGLRFDGEHVEWNGVPPDIRVAQSEEDIGNGKDGQLDYAITFLTSE